MVHRILDEMQRAKPKIATLLVGAMASRWQAGPRCCSLLEDVGTAKAKCDRHDNGQRMDERVQRETLVVRRDDQPGYVLT